MCTSSANSAHGPRQNGQIRLALSQAQVGQVLHAAGARSASSLLLAALGDPSASVAVHLEGLLASPERDGRLSRSLLSGLLVLASFPRDGRYLSTVQLARTLDMNTSTAHRYVSTLLAAGLLERDPTTRQYRLSAAHLAPDSY